MAAVMVVALMAMVPTVSAAPDPDSGFSPYPVGVPPSDSITIIKGTENVNISAWIAAIGKTEPITIVGAEGTDIEGETHTITDVSDFDVSEGWSKGLYGVGKSTATKTIFVEEPTITTKIKLEDGTDVTNGVIVEGQRFYVEVTTNFGAVLGRDENPAYIKLKTINPDGTEITEDAEGTPFKREDVTTDKVRFPSTGFYTLVDAGTYEITAMTPSPGKPVNNKLEAKAATVTLEVTTEVVTIDVEEATVPEGEDVIVTGTGRSKTWYSLEIDSGGGIFKTGVKNVYPGEKATADHTGHVAIPGEDPSKSRFAAVKTNAAGIFRAEIDTATTAVSTGSYTVYVEKDTDDEDKVEFRVVELKVTVETDKSAYVVGEDVEISGTSPAGDYIIVAIDDVIMSHERIKADDTYEYKWTETDEKIPGSYKIEVWNVPVTVPESKAGVYTNWKTYYPVGSSSERIPESADATITVYLSEPGLKAELSRTEVALGDEFWVKGEALGADNVLVLAIAPKGSGGTAIDSDTARTSPNLDENIYAKTVSVSAIDYTFEHKVDVHEDADGGEYLIVVLCPGKDDKFEKDKVTVGDFVTDSLVRRYGINTSSKTQDQLLDIIKDATVDTVGSDDLIWVGKVKCEEGKVTLNPIADVAAGEPLVVSGTTNRKNGHPIVITVKGPMELPAKTAYVENGTFNVTFDTTGAKVGTYTVKADDGDGHTDETTVEILTAASTPTPTATPHANINTGTTRL